MATKSIALAYCIDNLHTAEAIESALQQTDYTFDHFYCKKDSSNQPLSLQLQDYSGPVLLLMSDNFLRSISCMQRALQLIQQKHDQILPVVVDGFRHDDNGDVQVVHTRFEKIGDIIPYINYWQNQYLDLRGQRKHIEEDTDYDRDAFADHLRVLRQVSSEASEFLRVMRNMDYLTFEEFTDNHFAAFFEWVQDEEEWEAFQAKVPTVHIPPITQPADPEQYEREESALPEDEQTTEESSSQTEEEPQFIEQIPGLELLEESENIARIITQKIETIPPVTDQENTPEPEEGEEESNLEKHSAEVTENDSESEGEQPDEEDSPLGEEPPQPDPEPSLEEEQDEESMDETEQPSTPHEQPFGVNTEDGQGEEDSGTEQVSEDGLIQKGMQLIEQGDVERGLAFMNQSLQDYPNMNDLRYYYSLMMAQNTSDFTGAVNQLSTLLDMEPDHIDGNFLMGELAELEEDYAKALDYYKRVAELDSHYPDIYYRLGVVTLNHFPKEKKKAAKYFKKAAKRNKEHVDAPYQYALLMNEALGKPHKALKYFLKVSELDEDHPFVYYDLALLYYKNGDQDKARVYYKKAVRINPELKTEENDRAFLGTSEETTAVHAGRPFASTGPVSEQETIDALKENIRQLEALIHEKDDRLLVPTPEQKTVLITGATSGIGKATAYVFAREGYRLILNGRRAERLSELKDELQQRYGSTILCLPFDVSNYESVQSAIRRLEGDWRNIDILINNAGKAKGLAPIQEGELKHWEEMIDVNLKGLLYLTREVTPLMVQRGEGHVINLCSTAGKEVYPNGNVYCATKHAVDALTKAMRIDLYKDNIRVSQVSPAHVEETEFAQVRFDGDKERAKIYEDFNPLTSGDVAEAIYFIASQPPHVNVQDILMMGTQQANSLFIDRSGRRFDEEE